MSAHDRVRWDKIYRERRRQPYPAPDPLLLAYAPPVAPEESKRALDLACGFGQNGLWLASQGYTVDLMDISRVALAEARAEMASRNLRAVNLLQVDLDGNEIQPETYDLLCIFRYLKRDSMPMLRAAIVSGGRFIYETYNINYLDLVPEFNTDFLLMPGELAAMFEGWRIIHSADETHISQIVALKP
jgi:tellurite methyltransferase